MAVEEDYRRAAAWIGACDGLLIGAGAGMGVDSGLPDFRGDEGFWRVYPALRESEISFVEMANPKWFEQASERAWGFYGHRLNLYRKTRPHAGFSLLKAWGETQPCGGFVFTSNVDGQFQTAGFDHQRIVECHGSIHFLQCTLPCSQKIWSADDLSIEIDTQRCQAVGPLPTCPNCGRVARPNILMFADHTWISTRTDAQHQRYREWLRESGDRNLTSIECGAGTSIPTVREECQKRTRQLIRINPRHPEVKTGGISLEDPALAALTSISHYLPGAS